MISRWWHAIFRRFCISALSGISGGPPTTYLIISPTGRTPAFPLRLLALLPGSLRHDAFPFTCRSFHRIRLYAPRTDCLPRAFHQCHPVGRFSIAAPYESGWGRVIARRIARRGDWLFDFRDVAGRHGDRRIYRRSGGCHAFRTGEPPDATERGCQL